MSEKCSNLCCQKVETEKLCSKLLSNPRGASSTPRAEKTQRDKNFQKI